MKNKQKLTKEREKKNHNKRSVCTAGGRTAAAEAQTRESRTSALKVRAEEGQRFPFWKALT